MYSIWNHLVSFAEEEKTIIITTHYIEEARQAHTVSLYNYIIRYSIIRIIQ